MNSNIKYILENLSLEIMNYYLQEFNNNRPLKQGKHFSNPFLKEKQKTPSFNIYFSKKSNTWLYNDFATGERGNCIELVKQLYKLTFKEAVQKLEAVGFKPQTYLPPNKPQLISSLATDGFKRPSLNIKNFSLKEKDYWNQYGISDEILSLFEIFSLSEIFVYKAIEDENNFNPIFAYPYGPAFKIYRPLAKSHRFLFKGEKSNDFYFGYNQLPESGSTIYITGGEKDVMSLKANGFDAICMNSETASIPESLITELKARFENVVILYDNDETGLKRSIAIADEYNLIRIVIPKSDTVKDISDFFKEKFTAEDLNKLLNDKISVDNPEPLIEKKGPWSNISNSPLISEKIYENLPPFLQDICNVQNDPRSRDIVLISTITTLSGIFPTISGVYMGRVYHPNLYCLIIAPAASGKGNLGLIRFLGEAIHDSIVQRSKELYIQYKEQLKAYRKAKENSDLPEPEKPSYEVLFIPANSSSAAMVEQLSQNKGKGIIFDTEADAAGNALKNDWGNYSDMLRKSWHHEPVSSLRKTDMKFTEVSNPQLSLVLSGTPNQTTGIIKSVEDGLFSRFIFYTLGGLAKWLDVSPEGNKTNLTEHYKQCGRRAKDIYDHFIKYPATIELTKSQWEQLNQFGDRSLKEIYAFLTDEAASIPKRMGVIVYRITMILTCLRAYDQNSRENTLIASDLDFQTALQICEVLLDHSKLVYGNLPKVSSSLDPFKQKFYNNLPEDWFTSVNAAKIGAELRIQPRTVREYIRKMVDCGLLEEGKLGEYKKTGQPSMPSMPGLKVA